MDMKIPKSNFGNLPERLRHIIHALENSLIISDPVYVLAVCLV